MQYFLLIFGVFFYFQSMAQFNIDLGNDTIFCPPYPDTVQANHQMGSNLMIQQGTAPYTYAWHMEPYHFPGSTLVFHASTFLDDTTSATPNFLGGLDEIMFFLTVVDANNQTAMDSIKVYSPKFSVGFPIQQEAILLGDSILTGYPNIWGGIPPLTYLWRPNHGLLDSTNASFWTKPTQTTAYYLTVTDSAGCKGSAGISVIVYVSSLGVDEMIAEERDIVLYPNPITGAINLKDEGEIVKRVQIMDAFGRLLAEIKSNDFPYNMGNFAKGTYILKIETEVGFTSRSIVLK